MDNSSPRNNKVQWLSYKQSGHDNTQIKTDSDISIKNTKAKRLNYGSPSKKTDVDAALVNLEVHSPLDVSVN